jgi:hypothetical protein
MFKRIRGGGEQLPDWLYTLKYSSAITGGIMLTVMGVGLAIEGVEHHPREATFAGVGAVALAAAYKLGKDQAEDVPRTPAEPHEYIPDSDVEKVPDEYFDAVTQSMYWDGKKLKFRDSVE